MLKAASLRLLFCVCTFLKVSPIRLAISAANEMVLPVIGSDIDVGGLVDFSFDIDLIDLNTEGPMCTAFSRFVQ